MIRLPLIALLLAAAPADAALVDFTFFADAIDGSNHVDADGKVVDLSGQRISVRVQYDDAIAPDFVDPDVGTAIYGLNRSIGTFTGSIAGFTVTGGLTVRVMPDQGLGTGELGFVDRDQLFGGQPASNFSFSVARGVVTTAALPGEVALARYIAASTGGGGRVSDVAQRLVTGYFTEGPLRGEPTPAAAVPEPASWAMLIAGFGLLGAALRRARPVRSACVRQ